MDGPRLVTRGRAAGIIGQQREPSTRIVTCVVELGDGPVIQRYSAQPLWGERVLIKHISTWAACTEAAFPQHVNPRVFIDDGRPGDYAAAIAKSRPMRAFYGDTQEEFYLTAGVPRLDWDCVIEATGSHLFCGIAAEGGYTVQIFIYASFTVVEWPE